MLRETDYSLNRGLSALNYGTFSVRRTTILIAVCDVCPLVSTGQSWTCVSIVADPIQSIPDVHTLHPHQSINIW